MTFLGRRVLLNVSASLDMSDFELLMGLFNLQRTDGASVLNVLIGETDFYLRLAVNYE